MRYINLRFTYLLTTVKSTGLPVHDIVVLVVTRKLLNFSAFEIEVDFSLNVNLNHCRF